MTIQIQQVIFDPDGIVIGYQELDDIRVGGAVIMQKTVRLDALHPDYAEDIGKAHDRLLRLLQNALEDFDDSEPYVIPTDDEDEDDELGMGAG